MNMKVSYGELINFASFWFEGAMVHSETFVAHALSDERESLVGEQSVPVLGTSVKADRPADFSHKIITCLNYDRSVLLRRTVKDWAF